MGARVLINGTWYYDANQGRMEFSEGTGVLELLEADEERSLHARTGNSGARTGNFTDQIRNHHRMRFSVHTGITPRQHGNSTNQKGHADC
jgi:hypothetical protein